MNQSEELNDNSSEVHNPNIDDTPETVQDNYYAQSQESSDIDHVNYYIHYV
jgi:hypothetical protein